MRYFTIFLIVVLASVSLISKDYWYKTDFPDSEQINILSDFGRFIIADSNKLYFNESDLHWALLKKFGGDTTVNSVIETRNNQIKEIYLGTNHGIFYYYQYKITKTNISDQTDYPIKLFGQNDNFIYFNQFKAGLYRFDTKNKILDTLHFFDTITVKGIDYNLYPDVLCESNNIYRFTGNENFQKENIIFDSKINDFSNFGINYFATTNGFYSGSFEQKLPGMNCLEIAVNQWIIIDGVYDPYHQDSNFYYMTPFVATEQNGVYFEYSKDRQMYPFNEGLEDTNMAHIALTQDFRLKAVTKSNQVYVTQSIYQLGVSNDPQNNLQINPNPVKNSISISTTESSVISSIQIFDIFGSMVLESNGNQSAELNLDLSALPVGTYYCKAVIGRKIVVKKIMKI